MISCVARRCTAAASSSGLFCGGCHGDDEALVFHELVETVEEAIRLQRAGNERSLLRPRRKTLPTPSRAPPDNRLVRLVLLERSHGPTVEFLEEGGVG